MLYSIVDYYFRSRKDEIDLEIFDMLISFTDFLSFKEMFVSYRKVYTYASIILAISICKLCDPVGLRPLL